MAAYAFILSSSRFCPSLTGLAVSGGEECGANAEMTLKIVNCVAVWSLMTRSLQVDLVLSDMAATLSHNLFNWCSVILRTVMQRCSQNAYGTHKMQYLRTILQKMRPMGAVTSNVASTPFPCKFSGKKLRLVHSPEQ